MVVVQAGALHRRDLGALKSRECAQVWRAVAGVMVRWRHQLGEGREEAQLGRQGQPQPRHFHFSSLWVHLTINNSDKRDTQIAQSTSFPYSCDRSVVRRAGVGVLTSEWVSINVNAKV